MVIELDEYDREWDAMAHTDYELRSEIRQLRQRCVLYWQEIEQLREENAALRSQISRQELPE